MTGLSAGIDAMIFSAFPEVQQRSTSALTSAVLFTEIIRIFLPVSSDGFCGSHIGHGASSIGIREQDDCVGREKFSCFSHEADSAEYDDIRLDILSFDAQFEGITCEVSNILNFGAYIIMRKDDGVAHLFPVFDFFDDIRHFAAPSFWMIDSADELITYWRM